MSAAPTSCVVLRTKIGPYEECRVNPPTCQLAMASAESTFAGGSWIGLDAFLTPLERLPTLFALVTVWRGFADLLSGGDGDTTLSAGIGKCCPFTIPAGSPCWVGLLPANELLQRFFRRSQFLPHVIVVQVRKIGVAHRVAANLKSKVREPSYL